MHAPYILSRAEREPLCVGPGQKHGLRARSPCDSRKTTINSTKKQKTKINMRVFLSFLYLVHSKTWAWAFSIATVIGRWAREHYFFVSTASSRVVQISRRDQSGPNIKRALYRTNPRDSAFAPPCTQVTSASLSRITPWQSGVLYNVG